MVTESKRRLRAKLSKGHWLMSLLEMGTSSGAAQVGSREHPRPGI